MTISLLDVRSSRLLSDQSLEKTMEDRYLREFLLPLSLDRCVLFDDFLFGRNTTTWNLTLGTGASSSVFAEVGGTISLQTGITAGTVAALWGPMLVESPSPLEWWFEARLLSDGAAPANPALEFGLHEEPSSQGIQVITDVSVPTVHSSVSSLAMFAVDTTKSSGNKIRAIVRRGDDTPVGADTGWTLSSLTYYRTFGIRFAGHANGFAEFYIDGEKVATLYGTEATTGFLRPVFRVKNNGAADWYIIVDYVQVIGPRPVQ